MKKKLKKDWKQYLGLYISDLYQILYTSRVLPHDFVCKVSDNLRGKFSFYVIFISQKSLVVYYSTSENSSSQSIGDSELVKKSSESFWKTV